MSNQNTDETSKSAKATEVESKRSEVSADAGPTNHTVGGQDVNSGKKPEDKQSSVEQWEGDSVSDPVISDPS